MGMYYSDTHPDVEASLIKMMRDIPVWKKMEMLAQLNETGKMLALSGLRKRHPHSTEAEIQRRLAEMLLGKELAHSVFGE